MSTSFNISNATEFWTPITPSDVTPIDATRGKCNYIYVGGAGNITAVVNGVAVLFTAVPIGIWPISATRINATGTTATAMVAAF